MFSFQARVVAGFMRDMEEPLHVLGADLNFWLEWERRSRVPALSRGLRQGTGDPQVVFGDEPCEGRVLRLGLGAPPAPEALFSQGVWAWPNFSHPEGFPELRLAFEDALQRVPSPEFIDGVLALHPQPTPRLAVDLLRLGSFDPQLFLRLCESLSAQEGPERRELAHALERVGARCQHGPVGPVAMALARVWARWGDPPRALHWLSQAVQRGERPQPLGIPGPHRVALDWTPTSCCAGKLKAVKEPETAVLLLGDPPCEALYVDRSQYRCDACGRQFVAPGPETDLAALARHQERLDGLGVKLSDAFRLDAAELLKPVTPALDPLSEAAERLLGTQGLSVHDLPDNCRHLLEQLAQSGKGLKTWLEEHCRDDSPFSLAGKYLLRHWRRVTDREVVTKAIKKAVVVRGRRLVYRTLDPSQAAEMWRSFGAQV